MPFYVVLTGFNLKFPFWIWDNKSVLFVEALTLCADSGGGGINYNPYIGGGGGKEVSLIFLSEATVDAMVA